MHSKQNGFTLIEILVYIAVFAIVAGLLIGILSTATRVQNRETAAAEITQQLEFVLQNIQRYVRESSNIDIPTGSATSTLKLRTNNSSTDPILIFTDASNTAIYIQQGTGASTTLTSNRVLIGNFSVTKYENPSGHATIQLDMTLNYNTAISPAFSDVSRSLSTAIARVSAATFDSDLVPNADNTFSVGQTLNRWKDAFFGKIAIGTTTITNLFQIATATPILTVTNNGNVGVKIANPTSTLTVAGEIKTTAGGVRFPDNTLQTTAGGGAWIVSGTTVILASSTNFVGIGEPAPNYKLAVNGTISLNNDQASPMTIGRDSESAWILLSAYGGTRIVLNNNNSVAAGDLDDFSVYATSSTGTTGTPLFRIIGAVGSDYATSTGLGFVGIGTGLPKGVFHVRAAGNANALVVASSGNIGIGTTAPVTKLEIVQSPTVDGLKISQSGPDGNANIKLRSTGSGAPGISFDNGTGKIWNFNGPTGSGTDVFGITDSGSNFPGIYFRGDASFPGVGIGTSAPVTRLDVTISPSSGKILTLAADDLGNYDPFYLGVDGSGAAADAALTFINESSTEVMRLTASGNLGIGTTAPSSTLHIIGNYIQIPTVSGANPASADCDAASEAGRMIIRTDGAASTTLWVCKGTGGWYGL